METIARPEAEERQLATIETVDALSPIEDADAIEVAHIKGWELVVKKGEVAVGDQVLYLEIDSFLPLDDPRFAFLAARAEKTHNGVRGHVLKTARMRGVYSQGLALPLALFPELEVLPAGTDLAAALGIIKYEAPIPAEMSERAVGDFPTQFAPRTAATRAQNLNKSLPRLREKYEWEATEKLDGSSTTFINDGGTLRVAGRRWELAPPATIDDATAPWKLADELGMLERIPVGYTVQGELVGPGVVAKNTLQLKEKRFYAFSVLTGGRFVPRSEWPAALLELAVPVLDWELPETVAEMLAQVDSMKSVVNPAVQAEGVVWHNIAGAEIQCLGNRTGMKAINNKWLLKNG
ncbi:RNA ligase (ATP) [Arthrobacter sp. A2-55]|uniref:RNA ligase (ATP) n=1 Tax=Arthrobacter sp. A2-55 TaxID=2897337 RepID=UPI0021CD9075|nr:RNA ligase (ATP) [Arthrobacter sp. A2-55]MCU6481309.1 RNA ligase (ATP) [Arthrobacter sp. A2-55]